MTEELPGIPLRDAQKETRIRSATRPIARPREAEVQRRRGAIRYEVAIVEEYGRLKDCKIAIPVRIREVWSTRRD